MDRVDMASYGRHAWNQIRGISVEKLMRALRADGWAEEKRRSGTRPFYKDGARIVIHYHPGKTFGPKILRGILQSIGWSEADLKRLKLIK